MSRTLTIRQPHRAEARQLQNLIEASEHPGMRRRAQAVLLCAAGCDATVIAAALAVHPNTIYGDLQAFAQHGVAGVEALGRVGVPPSLTEEQKAAIRQLADRSPVELGLPWGRWSLAKLRDYLVGHRVLRAISREHLRRILKRGRCASGTSRKSSPAPTPAAGPFWAGFAGFGSICPAGVCCSSST
jgi:transposase